MNKCFPLLLCLLFVLVAGCSKTTGVMPWAPGVYSVTVDVERTMFTGPVDAENEAYAQARAHCAATGQELLVDELVRSSSWRFYSTRILFRCVTDEGAPREAIRKVDVEML